MAAWNVTLGAESWRFDPEDLTLGALSEIEARTGVGMLEWLEQIDAKRVNALRVLIWHLRGGDRARASVRQAVHEIDFRLRDFRIELAPESDTPLPADGESSETTG